MVHAGTPTGHPSRQLQAALLAAAIVAAGGLWAIGSAPAGSFYDDGIYVTLGHSLAAGTGLRYLNLPGTPAATHYPPGYPALLAICWWLGAELPRVLLLAKLLNAVFMAAAAGMLTWLLADGGAPPLAAAIGVIAGSIAVPVLALSTIPFSEPFFLALLLAVTLMTRRALRRDSTSHAALLAGLGWGALALVRTVGGVMIPVGAVLVFRASGRRAAAIALLGAMALLAPWIIWSGDHASDLPAILQGSYGSYIGWYLTSLSVEGIGLAGRIAGQNVSALLRPFGVLLGAPGPAWLNWIVLPAGAITLLFGVRAFIRISALLAATLSAYLLIVIVWPYPPDRFLWGIWPIVTAILALGLVELVRRRGTRRWANWSLTGLLLTTGVGAGGYLWRQSIGVSHRAWEGPQQASAQSMEPAVRWVRAHAPPGAVIATVDDPLLYLYSGHQAVPVLAWSAAEHVRPQNVDTAEANLARILADYRPALVVLPGGGTPEAFAVERMWRKGKRLELVDTLAGGGAVFRPLPPDSLH
jgi:hypothetical protein